MSTQTFGIILGAALFILLISYGIHSSKKRNNEKGQDH